MGMGWVSAFQRFPCRGEAGLLGNTLQIRVHLCSSVVEPKNGSERKDAQRQRRKGQEGDQGKPGLHNSPSG